LSSEFSQDVSNTKTKLPLDIVLGSEVKSVATTFSEFNKHFNKTPDDFQQLYEAENPSLCQAEESKTKYFYFLYFSVTYVSIKPCHIL